MDYTEWILFILAVQLIHFAGTWKLYQKAGRKAWEAAVPVYNAIVLMQIIRRPRWWVILLFIPIINLLMFPVIWVETIRSFGKNSLLDTWLVILTLGFYSYYVNYTQDVTYVADRSLSPKTALGEWVSSIVFAVVAATLVHTYFMQPYVIPTGSLEKTLLIGDFLLVSKFHYGARVPMTTVAAPMVHDTLPLVGTRSYLKKPQLPYMRLPKLTDIERNDIVVFSWPADTVRVFFRKEAGVEKPIDKKSNYVKRCVGVPGDSLEVRDGYVFINGERTKLPYRAKPQYTFTVYANKGVSSRLLREKGIRDFTRKYLSGPLTQPQVMALSDYLIGANQTADGEIELYTDHTGIPVGVIRSAGLNLREVTERERTVVMTEKEAAALEASPSIDSIRRDLQDRGIRGVNIFPQDPAYSWNNDNFGPIYIPEAGATVTLTPESLPLYKKLIRDYEGHSVAVRGRQVLIDGQVTDSYTFAQDYYWMMGDNRHRSEDSRTWGYVPEDHIVGKPVFIWMSIENINDNWRNWNIRWDRVFTTVDGEGEPQSYFRYFLIALAAWFVFDFFWKRRKKAS